MKTGLHIYLAVVFQHKVPGKPDYTTTVLSAWLSEEPARRAAMKHGHQFARLYSHYDIKAELRVVEMSKAGIVFTNPFLGGKAVVRAFVEQTGNPKRLHDTLPWYEVIEIPIQGAPLELLAAVAE